MISEKEGIVLKVRLNRPEKRNAISSEVMQNLEKVCEFVENDNEIRAMVLTGEGSVFSAGADLKEISTLYGKAKHDFTQRAQRLLRRIQRLPALTIAAINGHAFGGGLELAMACDLRLSVPHAKLGLTEVRLGLIPAWGGTQRLPHLVMLGRAKHMVLLGEPIETDDALEMGLINRIVEKDQLLQSAMELAMSTPSDVRERKTLYFG